MAACSNNNKNGDYAMKSGMTDIGVSFQTPASVIKQAIRARFPDECTETKEQQLEVEKMAILMKAWLLPIITSSVG